MTRLTYHPLLFALYPFLFIYSNNLDEYPLFSDLYVPIALTLIACAAVLLVAYALLKDKSRAALVVSLCLILFFSYGHVLQALRGSSVAFLKKTQHQQLLAAYGLFFCLALFLICWIKNGLKEANLLLDVISATLVAVCVFTVISFGFGAGPPEKAQSTLNGDIIPLSRPERPPDIYFIVLDSYGSQSTMKDVYGYDSGEFIDHLRSEGFYVPLRSRSNYAFTFLSIASTLNMQQLTWLSDKVGKRSNNRKIPYQMIKDNTVMRSLKGIGYKYVQLKSGWQGVGINPNADWNIECNGGDELTNVIVQTTILSAFESGIFGEYSKNRATGCHRRAKFLSCIFSTVPEVQHRITGPRFMFIHVPAPHPPYVFGPDGEEICTNMQIKEDENGADSPGSGKSYRDQFIYVAKKTREMVDRILAESENPPVIIITADHGHNIEEKMVREMNARKKIKSKYADMRLDHRMRIFSAYYMPGNRTENLYDSISPVNTFRVIFNTYFNTTYPPLADDSFYSDLTTPYLFTNVTKRIYAYPPPSV